MVLIKLRLRQPRPKNKKGTEEINESEDSEGKKKTGIYMWEFEYLTTHPHI